MLPQKGLNALSAAVLLVALLVPGFPAWTAAPPATAKNHPQQAKAAVAPSTSSLQGVRFDRIGNGSHLGLEDVARYTRIFAFQEIGNFKKANEVIRQLDDHRLMGHVLAQRYLSRDYKSTYQELAEWMKAYADHPPAQKIHDLALRLRPARGAAALVAPRPGKGMSGYHDYDSGQLAQPYLDGQKYSPREQEIMRKITRDLSKNQEDALERLESAEARRIFSPTKYDALQARVAEALFRTGKVDKAYALAAASSDRSGKEVPLAGWIAGLAAWKQEEYAKAARYFERTAESRRSSAWMAAGGAYWAARAYLRNHQPEKVGYWLHQAAKSPRSFYGIIAVKALGLEQARFNWDVPDLDDRLAKALAGTKTGRRALALMDSGRPDLAEQELRQMNPGKDPALQEAMMAFAHKAGVPAFEMRLGSGLRNGKDGLYDAALYPDAPWQPKGGYQVDRALVHAFIRQESKFDAGARNKSSGALGLMQLMPATAMTVARHNGIRGLDKERLLDPATNIRLGQKYLADLLQDDNVQDNLFKLAVAYNAGPGKLSRWEKSLNYENDPLLFIESIPVAETRAFVERVLTNYWIYRLKYNQSTDSLEKVASGEWPVYVAEDIHRLASFADASR